jgi:hypothetical protein
MNSATPLCTLTRRDRQAGSMRRHLRNGRHNMGLQRAKGRWQKVGGCSAMSRQRAMAMASQWWNVVPKGCVRGFWWSTMSANVGIPAHTSISFSGLAGSRRVHVQSFKKERALRNGCCPVVTFAGGGAVGGQPCQSKLRSRLTHPFTFSVMAAPGVLVIFARGWWEKPCWRKRKSQLTFLRHISFLGMPSPMGPCCTVVIFAGWGVLIFNHVNEN